MTDNNKSTTKPRAALVSIYDVYALGPRIIQAELMAGGFECDLILFRENLTKGGFRHRPEPFTYWPTEREYELLEELLARRRPDVLGVSFRSFALDMAVRISEMARRAGSMVIWGGSHPTLMPEECLDHADLVCVGEGEGAMVDLMRALRDGSSYKGVPNLCLREGGELVRNPIRPLIQDLDALGFPSIGGFKAYTIEGDELLEKDSYLDPDKPILYTIVASRGCPFKCTFCCNDAFRKIYGAAGPYLRKRSPENVILELEGAREKLDVRAVGFQDELFSANKKWSGPFFEAYKEKIKLPFVVELHPKSVTAEFAQSMKDAGGVSVHMGVQSGSERARLEEYGRPETDEEIKRASEACHDAGLSTWYDFIFNDPYENGEDLERTLELMLSLSRPHNFKIFSLCYLPGSKIAERALADGTISPEDMDHVSKKGFTGLWANHFSGRDKDNSFFMTLAWIEALKYSRKRMELLFFSDGFSDSFHVAPRALVRLLSRSRFLRERPIILHQALCLFLRAANWKLGLARALRSRAYKVKKMFSGR